MYYVTVIALSHHVSVVMCFVHIIIIIIIIIIMNVNGSFSKSAGLRQMSINRA